MPTRRSYRSEDAFSKGVTFVTTEEQWQALLMRAEADRRSVAHIIREAITEYLQRIPGEVGGMDRIANLRGGIYGPENSVQDEQEKARLAERKRMQEAGEFTPIEEIQDHISTALDHNGRLRPDICETCRNFKL